MVREIVEMPDHRVNKAPVVNLVVPDFPGKMVHQDAWAREGNLEPQDQLDYKVLKGCQVFQEEEVNKEAMVLKVIL